MDSMLTLIAGELADAYQEREWLRQAEAQLQEQLMRVQATLHFRNGQVAALETLQAKADASAAPTIEHEAMPLTPREREMMVYVAAGMTDKEIAPVMAIALPTLKGMMNRAFGKLGANNRTMAAMMAILAGVITLGEVTDTMARHYPDMRSHWQVRVRATAPNFTRRRAAGAVR